MEGVNSCWLKDWRVILISPQTNMKVVENGSAQDLNFFIKSLSNFLLKSALSWLVTRFNGVWFTKRRRSQLTLTIHNPCPSCSFIKCILLSQKYVKGRYYNQNEKQTTWSCFIYIYLYPQVKNIYAFASQNVHFFVQSWHWWWFMWK